MQYNLDQENTSLEPVVPFSSRSIPQCIPEFGSTTPTPTGPTNKRVIFRNYWKNDNESMQFLQKVIRRGESRTTSSSDDSLPSLGEVSFASDESSSSPIFTDKPSSQAEQDLPEEKNLQDVDDNNACEDSMRQQSTLEDFTIKAGNLNLDSCPISPRRSVFGSEAITQEIRPLRRRRTVSGGHMSSSSSSPDHKTVRIQRRYSDIKAPLPKSISIGRPMVPILRASTIGSSIDDKPCRSSSSSSSVSFDPKVQVIEYDRSREQYAHKGWSQWFSYEK